MDHGAGSWTEHSQRGGTWAPAGMSRPRLMEGEETEGSSSQQGELLSRLESSREPESEAHPAPVAIGICPQLPPTLPHTSLRVTCWSPAACPAGGLAPAGTNGRFLKVSKICLEIARAGACRSLGSFTACVLNTEPGTLVATRDKTVDTADRVPALMVVLYQWGNETLFK